MANEIGRRSKTRLFPRLMLRARRDDAFWNHEPIFKCGKLPLSKLTNQTEFQGTGGTENGRSNPINVNFSCNKFCF
jgi:hypothetical protein